MFIEKPVCICSTFVAKNGNLCIHLYNAELPGNVIKTRTQGNWLSFVIYSRNSTWSPLKISLRSVSDACIRKNNYVIVEERLCSTQRNTRHEGCTYVTYKYSIRTHDPSIWNTALLLTQQLGHPLSPFFRSCRAFHHPSNKTAVIKMTVKLCCVADPFNCSCPLITGPRSSIVRNSCDEASINDTTSGERQI